MEGLKKIKQFVLFVIFCLSLIIPSSDMTNLRMIEITNHMYLRNEREPLETDRIQLHSSFNLNAAIFISLGFGASLSATKNHLETPIKQ